MLAIFFFIVPATGLLPRLPRLSCSLPVDWGGGLEGGIARLGPLSKNVIENFRPGFGPPPRAPWGLLASGENEKRRMDARAIYRRRVLRQ